MTSNISFSQPRFYPRIPPVFFYMSPLENPQFSHIILRILTQIQKHTEHHTRGRGTLLSIHLMQKIINVMIFHRFSFNFYEFLRVKTSINFILGCKQHIPSDLYRLLCISISLWSPVLIECVQPQWSGGSGGTDKKTGGLC